MRWHSKLALGLALSAAFLVLRPAGTVADTDDLGQHHREILTILHGEARGDVSPSPYLCWRRGEGVARPEMPAFEWFVLGTGSCEAVYRPDMGAIHSPLSDKGEIVHFFFDDEKYRRLESSLTELATAVETSPLALGDRFDLQMTVWELIAALQFRRDIDVDWYPPISQARVDRLLVPALRVLRGTLFSRQQVDALPATLRELAELSGEAAIRPSVQRLTQDGEAFVEDLFPSQLHNSFSQGRMYSRVFLTMDDAAELERFRKALAERANTRLQGFSWQRSAPTPEDDLTVGSFLDVRYLPLEYSSLRAVLILYFNVLDTNYRVVPTRMVATWNELWWTSELDDAEDLREAEQALEMRIVKYQKQLGLSGGRFPDYRTVSEDEVSRVLFTDVNPVAPGTKVTTVRGQCLSCHSTKLMTYNMHRRLVGFVRPLSLDPEELEPRQMEAEASRSFREWTQRYLEPVEDGP